MTYIDDNDDPLGHASVLRRLEQQYRDAAAGYLARIPEYETAAQQLVMAADEIKASGYIDALMTEEQLKEIREAWARQEVEDKEPEVYEDTGTGPYEGVYDFMDFELGKNLDALDRDTRTEIAELLEKCFYKFITEFGWTLHYKPDEQVYEGGFTRDWILKSNKFWDGQYPPVAVEFTPKTFLDAVKFELSRLTFSLVEISEDEDEAEAEYDAIAEYDMMHDSFDADNPLEPPYKITADSKQSLLRTLRIWRDAVEQAFKLVEEAEAEE